MPYLLLWLKTSIPVDTIPENKERTTKAIVLSAITICAIQKSTVRPAVTSNNPKIYIPEKKNKKDNKRLTIKIEPLFTGNLKNFKIFGISITKIPYINPAPMNVCIEVSFKILPIPKTLTTKTKTNRLRKVIYMFLITFINQ